MTRKINKYMFLCGCAGIMLIGFASGAAACPTNSTWIKIGDGKNYDNCTIHGTEIDIGSNNSFKNASINATAIKVNGENNSFKNASINATTINVNGENNNFTNAKLRATDLVCPLTGTQIWTGASFFVTRLSPFCHKD